MPENTPDPILDQFKTDLCTALDTAHNAGATPATLARVAALTFEGIFAALLAEDPDDVGLFNAVRASHCAAEALTKSIEDGD